MNIALYGTGRAAGALGIVLSASGHSIVEVRGRSPEGVAETKSLFNVVQGPVDLRIVAVSDDALAEVASVVASLPNPVPTVHVSGAVPASVLGPVRDHGVQIGSFHPLQTMPDPVSGARQLQGAWIGITAPEPLYDVLFGLASSIGCHGFPITDADKPLYHAAAAASANFVLAVLSVAEDLFDAGGVPFASARPLVDAIIENAFTLGPADALTGPIARGDRDTVIRQLAAVRAAVPARYDDFVFLSQMTARTAGTADEFTDVLA